MLNELIDKEKQHLNYFFENLNLKKGDQILQLCANCKGLIFFTGVGKSGLVAQKIALTMTSTGTKALFICPTNAIHGDLGFVSELDLFIVFSKSGESEELLNLIPFVRNKGAQIISIVCKKDSRLEKASDYCMHLPLENELCPFDLAPTISTTIQMVFGDFLTVSLMKHKNFSMDQYALNHPGGKIGKRLLVKVRDLMVKDKEIPVAFPKQKLVEVLGELSDKRCGCVLIVNPQFHLEGIFTDGDLRRALQTHGPTIFEKTMDQLMTVSAKWISPDKLAWEAMQYMEADQKKPVTILPVVEDKTLIGLIKIHDILQSGV